MIEYEVLISIDESSGNKYYVYAKDSNEAISKAFEKLTEEFEGFEIKIKCVRKVKKDE